MNYIIIGNDRRFDYLHLLLKLSEFTNKEPADLLILGPRDSIHEHVDKTNPGALIWGGIESTRDIDKLNRRKITPSEQFKTLNSLATAEGSLSLAIAETSGIIHGTSILVLGFGFLGKKVADIFQNVGSRVTVCSQDEELAVAKFSGYSCITLKNLNELPYPLIINTIPAKILSKGQLETVPKNSILIELASIPCCENTIENPRIISAEGLPGRFSPAFAAECIYNELLFHVRKEPIVNGNITE